MANRPKGYGMTAELNNKKAAKYDNDLAVEAIAWISSVIGETLAAPSNATDVQSSLKDGDVLVRLINTIAGTKTKINQSKMAFKQMENIGNFLDGCEAIDMSKDDLFQTCDLFDGSNIPQVINGIHALGRKASSKGFGGLGPAESTANKREFSDEQLRAGEGVIGLQAGSNKGASQAGQNFGKTRAIID